MSASSSTTSTLPCPMIPSLSGESFQNPNPPSLPIRPLGLRCNPGGVYRKADAKGGAEAKLTFHSDLTSMGIDHIFHNLRAEAGTGRLRAHRATGEESVTNLRRHAPPGISDRDMNDSNRRVRLPRNRNGSSSGNFRDRVIHEIVEPVIQPTFVGQYCRQDIEVFAAEGNIFLGREHTQSLQGVFDHL